ncbi:1,4-dihydroxy-6-naphthoate synthase [Lewinella aquimaris]|uniref:1,4-dihydroxy-6-naphtoate synthase n=1 Tax=Neolewinella aquimaris TaxID=1835722 RepID=A0A840E7N0_9BACT|nr:1,4-dihydroxy-6-naphthoate synthase [Neolewinella aquimaris]MBB4078068.1 1,4-dihydroxy-6-naphthoate synthase [Neolewinella aquimaris]
MIEAGQPLTLGFSPCPNDTFIFDALVHHRIDMEGLSFDVRLADVEELNRLAFQQQLDVTKLSYHAFGHLTAHYKLLNAGSALGRGVGPLLVETKKENSGGVIDSYTKIAIPGQYTTANYLLGLAYPTATKKSEVLFSDIEDAVIAGDYDAGVLIHENRFTYAERGLEKIADLGEYWESTTGYPIPLGGIVVRRSFSPELQGKIDRVLARSVRYAFEHPQASKEYVAAHAQSMDPAVREKHIGLYVNDFTRNLGPEGQAAVRHFIADGRGKGIIPAGADDYIV